MGAWGLGLFESDHDLDRIGDMYDDAGLGALEDKARERAKKAKSQSADAKSTSHYEDDDYPQLSLHAAYCADVNLVRGHLDSGMLQKLINQKKAAMDELSKKKTDEPIMDDYYHSRAVYELVLLGACAMSLGCKIRSDFKELLIAKYRTTELQRDALGQMQVALGDGPDRYKEGVPYHFKGLKELPGDREREDRIYPNSKLINVPAPFGAHRSTRPEPKREYPANMCGGCGADRRLQDEPLLLCGKCKFTKYCSKVCQQAHFKQHKQTCKHQ